jgi:hypothetical protein
MFLDTLTLGGLFVVVGMVGILVVLSQRHRSRS